MRTGALVALTAVLAGGCGGGAGPSPGPGTGTSAPAASSASASTAGLPVYYPSTVVSQTASHLQLTSPDSVSTITAFYDKALANGGWTIISSAKTAASTSITARRDHAGVTVSVSAAGVAGTTISISAYHV